MKLYGSLRIDYNPEFDPKVNPRIAAVYTLAEKHNFRASYQNGFRFPALFEAISYVNNGNVRRVGGLAYINEGLGYLDNSYSLAAVNADAAGGLTVSQAVVKNKDLLEITNLGLTQPECINSFEVGYKSALANNKVVIDIHAYTNVYTGFLGQVEVSVPRNNTVQAGSDEAVIAMLASNRNAQQTRYRVYTNARNSYNNYGSSLGITYNFFQIFIISGNVNYNDIVANKQRDVFVTGFNTPNLTANISFANREVARNVGFNIVWRWQDSFLWESPLANGIVPAYQTFDAQVTYRLPQYKTTIKGGGSNIFNRRYIQYAAGPTIGGLYYVSVTLDGIFNK